MEKPSTEQKATVVIRHEIPAQEFWKAIWGSGWESCGWWQKVRFHGDAEWNKIGTATLWIDDPDDEEATISRTIGLDDLVEAYNDLWAGSYTGQSGFMNRSYLDLSDMDCIGSDGILQFAVLGSVVYG